MQPPSNNPPPTKLLLTLFNSSNDKVSSSRMEIACNKVEMKLWNLNECKMHISLFNLNISIRLVGINSQISMVIFCCIENYLNLNWLNLLMPFDYKHWKCHETAQLLKFHHTLKYWKKKVHVRQQHGEEQVSQVTQSFDEEKKHVEREWKLCIISMFFISCLKLAKCLIAFHTLHVAGCYCTLFLSLSLSPFAIA